MLEGCDISLCNDNMLWLDEAALGETLRNGSSEITTSNDDYSFIHKHFDEIQIYRLGAVFLDSKRSWYNRICFFKLMRLLYQIGTFQKISAIRNVDKLVNKLLETTTQKIWNQLLVERIFNSQGDTTVSVL
jgi:hypothetical protein